jgi:peptide chain release factor 3
MDDIQIKGLESPEAREALGDFADDVIEELELVKGATHQFEMDEFLAGKANPRVFWYRLG